MKPFAPRSRRRPARAILTSSPRVWPIFRTRRFATWRSIFCSAPARPERDLIAFDAAPGVTEETSGEAFSGLSAKLLDNMLAAIGFDRSSATLAYVSPWRPPGDRALSPHEAAIFAPFARRRVELARPDVLLIFGEAPARIMLTTNEPVGKLRGKAFEARCGAHVARAFVFSSLEAMLKSAALKPAAWRDLRRAAEALEQASSGAPP